MEKIIRWFTDNHVAANLLMVAVMIVGFLTWFKLKKEIFPETSIDVVAIKVPYPNATPEEVERGVCIPIEESLQDINGIDALTSTAAPGYGVVVVEVASGYDVREVMDDVKSRVDAVDNLPEQTEQPTIEELVLNAQVISVAISADADAKSLRQIADRIREELLLYRPPPPEGFWDKLSWNLSTSLRGEAKVSKAELTGIRPFEISIELSESALREHGLTFDQVAAAIRNASLDLPAGSVKSVGGDILVRTEARRYTAIEFESIPVISTQDGRELLLGQLATIKDTFEEIDVDTKFNGTPSLVLTAYRVGEEDTLQIAETVKRFVADEAPKLFPNQVKLEIWRDDSKYLKGRLELLGRNAFWGLILVLLILSLFLRPSLAFFVALGIPASFLGTVMVMPWLGISINMISLFAFILVLGIVVDDAIVVGENVYDRICGGEDPRIASIKGTHEVGMVVIFGVLTTMMAFTPMLGLSGVSGKIWPNIPLIVIPTLFFSLLQSKLVLPSHLSALRAPKKKGIIAGLLNGVDKALRWFVKRMYQPVLNFGLHYRYVTILFFLALIATTFTLIGTGWVKSQFFPQVEADIVTAKVRLPEGVSYETTVAVIEKIRNAAETLEQESIAKSGKPLIRNILASSGIQPFQIGFSQIEGSPQGSNLGEITLELYEGGARSLSADAVAQRWRELTGPIPGADELSFQTEAAGGGNAIDLELTGNNLAELTEATDYVKEQLANYAGVIDISDSDRPGKNELKLAITSQGEAAGLQLGDIARQVRQAFYGEEIQRLQRGRDEVKVMLRYPEEERESLGNLESMKIRDQSGKELPFAAVAGYTYGRSASSIQRSDRRRTITVSADVDKSQANANEVVGRFTTEVLQDLRGKFPGVGWGFKGEQKDQRQSVTEIGTKFLLALLGIYVLLAVPLRSFFQPLIVMAVIPFGIVGAVAGHMIFDMPLSIMSLCGIVALAGIVVNDSLVMVDFVNRYRAEGHTVQESAIHAGGRRFRPILLTSLTTFAGLFPMVLETDLQARFLVPMAVALAFGILFATVITLFLVPSLYMVLEDSKAALRWLKTGSTKVKITDEIAEKRVEDF